MLHQRLFNDTFKANLASCSNDLAENMENLHKLFRIDAHNADLPVAYATNTMYVLARNGCAASSADKIEGEITVFLLVIIFYGLYFCIERNKNLSI